VAAQQPAATPTLLTITGDVERALHLTAEDLARLPRRSLRASEHGKEALFEGVSLFDALKLAGVPSGENLRGRQLAKYVLVEAADGYQVIFSLAELDTAMTDREVLLADRRDGSPLRPEEGPLRIVVAGEKRPARWVRQVRELKVGNVK
jgi:DMSO/TMAO reductase YedYZ molybdopterin-dependent catalytic subunit